MRMYNQTTNQIEIVPTQLTVNGIDTLTSRMTEVELNSIGYFNLSYNSTPNTRYYAFTETKALVGNIYTITKTAEDKDVDEVKRLMKSDIKDRFLYHEANAIFDTGLGYSVNGGRRNKEDFTVGQKYGFPSVKASDNKFYPVTDADYTTIITAIEMGGIQLYQNKWAKESEVDALLTIDDCILYEATPYDYIITAQDVLYDLSGTLVEGEILVKYKNNCKDW